MKNRLPKFDAVQGLIRNPQYLKDYKAFFGGLGEPKRFSRSAISYFCMKYHLQAPLDPEEWKNKTPEEIEAAAIFDERTEVPIVQVGQSSREDSETIPIEDPKEKERCVSGHAPEGTLDEDIVCAKIDSVKYPKRFLFCRIDLYAPKKDILIEVERLVDFYGESVDQPKEKNRPERVNKFSVWDNYVKTGNMSETAKKLRLDESTALKAFNRAQEIIERILEEEYEPEE